MAASVDHVEFTERLLEVIDSGRRTATYKLALVLALLNVCARKCRSDGLAPNTVFTRDLAEEVAALYWPQVASYQSPQSDEVFELRQISLPRSKIVEAVRGFRGLIAPSGRASLYLARRALTGDYAKMVDAVEVTLCEQPLPRLQSIGTSTEQYPFLYELPWGAREAWSTRRLRPYGPRGVPIHLLGGAGDHLVRLAPLVRPLVELHWTRAVAEFTGLPLSEERLREHLFGTQRRQPPRPLRAWLADLQGNACFYCQEQLGGRTHADHFIPWARSSNDAIENFVMADSGCNGDKTDLLAHPEHVARWAARNQQHAAELSGRSRELRWETDRVASESIARSIYGHLPTGLQPFWLGRGRVEPGDPRLAIASLS